MFTTRLSPVPPLEDDALIVHGLTQAAAGVEALQEATAERYLLGLRNADGQIYRHLDVPCMRTVIAISESLRSFGLAAEPGSLEPAAHGCQIVFSRPPVILPFGFAPRHKVRPRDLPRRPTTPARTLGAAPVHGN